MERHLPALESLHTAEAGAGFLALLTATGGLAVAGARAAADALARMTGAFFRLEVVQFHDVCLPAYDCGAPQRSSTTRTRWLIFAIIPRVSFVSGRSEI
jgi:hypothetical protein